MLLPSLLLHFYLYSSPPPKKNFFGKCLQPPSRLAVNCCRCLASWQNWGSAVEIYCCGLTWQHCCLAHGRFLWLWAPSPRFSGDLRLSGGAPPLWLSLASFPRPGPWIEWFGLYLPPIAVAVLVVAALDLTWGHGWLIVPWSVVVCAGGVVESS